MKLFIFVFFIFLAFIFGMAIGVFFGRSPIKGSCGGINKIMGKKCPYCKSTKKCKKNINM